MKEGDRVQVGNKEVLVWHMEGVRKKEQISEDTLSGQKDSPEKISDENAFETKVVKVDNAYSNKPTKAMKTWMKPLATLITLVLRCSTFCVNSVKICQLKIYIESYLFQICWRWLKTSPQLVSKYL